MLGPNGAGKTTTIEILEGFRRRTGGDVRVLGVDPERAGASWRERIGVVLQSSTPEAELTVVETLRLYAGFYAAPAPIDHLLELCGLQDQASMREQAALRAANSAGSMSRSRSSGIPSSSSSTSRPPASTRRRGEGPGA